MALHILRCSLHRGATRALTNALLVCVAALLGPPISRAAAQSGATAAPVAPSLYERLGGYDAIARFVDTAFPRVAAHPKLHRLFQGHSRDSQFRQRQLIVDMLCSATGGPCVYIGRPMKPVHTGLGITADDWKVFIGVITAALDERRVGPREKAELLQLFEQRFRPDVVDVP
jgi:hemoglobin